MRNPGVYEIANSVSGRRYIGSSIDVPSRLKNHRSKLLKGAHSNDHLQKAWTKYGPSVFEFRMLKPVPIDKLIVEEQSALDQLPRPMQYNICPVAGNRLGSRFSQKSKERCSAASKARWSSPMQRAKMIASIRVGFAEESQESKRSRLVKQREAWTPEKRAVHREASKAQWRDPDKRKLLERSVKEAMTPEIRAVCGEASKKRWADPVKRAALCKRLSDAHRRCWGDPVWRERQLVKLQSKRDLEIISRASSAAWRDPIKRANMLAGQAAARMRSKAI